MNGFFPRKFKNRTKQTPDPKLQSQQFPHLIFVLHQCVILNKTNDFQNWKICRKIMGFSLTPDEIVKCKIPMFSSATYLNFCGMLMFFKLHDLYFLQAYKVFWEYKQR